jgi:hypothetical protein
MTPFESASLRIAYLGLALAAVMAVIEIVKLWA